MSRATAMLALGLVPAMTGCHTWQTQTGSAESVLASRPVDQPIRIATTSHPGMMEVGSPRVTNDSLFGRGGDTKSEVAIPFATITKVQVRKGSAVKTVLLVGGLTAFTLVIAAGVADDLCDDDGVSQCW